MRFGQSNGTLWVSVIEPDFDPASARRIFGQQSMQWVGMVRPIAVQLKHLVPIGHDREIGGWLERLHLEDGRQKRDLGRHIPHQQVQPDPTEAPSETICINAIVIHTRTVALHPGCVKRRGLQNEGFTT